jgi:hypothetical protein
MIGRRVRGSRLLVWWVGVGLVVPGLGLAGCGRRTYPARDPVTFVKTDGSVEVGAGFNQCPDLTINVSPSQGELTQPFQVEGNAFDPDDDPVTISLHADSGTFSPADQFPSTFSCAKPGLITITATVSDGSCQTMKSVSIFCLGTHPGDGGDGPVAPRDGGGGGAGGSDGSTNTGAGGKMVVTNTCPMNEPASSVAACADCTTNNCSLAPNPDGTDGCCGLASAADQVLCIAAAECFTTNKCTAAGSPSPCYCGNSGADCYVVPGAANGPCVAEVAAAAKTTDPSTIRGIFTSSAATLGRAVNLLTCRGTFCSTECGIQ